MEMRTRRCLWSIAVLGLGIGCVGRPGTPARPRQLPNAPSHILIGFNSDTGKTIRTVDFEEYVKAAALSEFAPAAGAPETIERMLEVQAIISRTFAFAHLGRHARDGFDLCTTTHCQLFDASRPRTSRWKAAAEAAVSRTAGTIVWFDGRPASTVFHADCGGHTSAAEAVWGGADHPYLIARPDDGVPPEVHAAWRYEVPRNALVRALNADARTRVGMRLDSLSIAQRDAAGRALLVVLHGDHRREVPAEHLREVLVRAFGVRSIKSTWFEVQRTRSAFVFDGRGFGHGVGLCQAGALAHVRAGTQPRAVLRRYYPGTRLIVLR